MPPEDECKPTKQGCGSKTVRSKDNETHRHKSLSKRCKRHGPLYLHNEYREALDVLEQQN